MFRLVLCVGVALGFLASTGELALAGMPSPLPSSWTAQSPPPSGIGETRSVRIAPFAQAFSFFVAMLLAVGYAVKWLWHVLRKDIAWLPRLGYGSAMAFIVLWGLLFIVVLTMISGARELMTPGAWRKQGWTYRLAETSPPAEPISTERRQALERLRQALWHYAAQHQGRLPESGNEAISAELFGIPGSPGLRISYVAGQTVDENGRLLAFEPEIDSDQRLVLLTNGVIGELHSAEIRDLLSKVRRQ